MIKSNLPDPIEAIKFRMEQMGWKQSDLVSMGCGTRSHISEILNRKRKINLSFIRKYHKIADATPLEVLIQDYNL
jgi:HTH-type transcriptional regulator / antitoxin HigA